MVCGHILWSSKKYERSCFVKYAYLRFEDFHFFQIFVNISQTKKSAEIFFILPEIFFVKKIQFYEEKIKKSNSLLQGETNQEFVEFTTSHGLPPVFDSSLL